MGDSRSFRSGGFGCPIGREVGLAAVGMFGVLWVLWLLSLRNLRNRRHPTRLVGMSEPPLVMAMVFLLLFLMLGKAVLLELVDFQ